MSCFMLATATPEPQGSPVSAESSDTGGTGDVAAVRSGRTEHHGRNAQEADPASKEQRRLDEQGFGELYNN